MPSHPGPPDLARRVSTKRTIPECPMPTPSQVKMPRLDAQRPITDETNCVDDQPPPWCTKNGLFLESKNVTSLNTHEAGMANRRARLSLVQEHSVPDFEMKQMKYRLKHDRNRLLVASPTDHNNPRSAGVAAIARDCDTLFEFEPIMPAFRKFRDCGRAIHLGYGMGRHGKILSIFNVYGHSGGAQDARKAKLTSAILQACIAEAMHYTELYNIMVGDLNGDFDSFEELGTLVTSMGWQDLNSIADTWGQTPNQPTCRTALSNQPTIRDYCLVCPKVLPLVQAFRVVDADLCPVHSTLQLQLDLSAEDRWVHQTVPKRTLKELLIHAFEDRFGTGPIQPPDDLEQDAERLCNPDDLPVELADFDSLTKPSITLKHFAAKEFKNAKADYAIQRDSFNLQAKKHMDLCLATVAPNLRQALKERNTTQFWRVFWETVEEATIAFTYADNPKLYRGRGNAPVKLVQQQTPRINQARDGYAMHSPDWLAGIQHHANRCKFIADNLAILAKGRLSEDAKQAIQVKVEACQRKVLHFLEWQCHHQEEMTLPVQDDPKMGGAENTLFPPPPIWPGGEERLSSSL